MDFAQGRRRTVAYNFVGEDDEQDEPKRPHRFDPSAEQPSSSAAAADPPVEKEHMFDKIVTPSDVGKLNRLVIPKQHAEKYFPLDTSTHEKGLLLSFDDRIGKQWRFRYSYWNSSQSYVMTKGWSRFVKEKRLDAGDTVSFGRGVDDKDRLFIDWKHRPEIHEPQRLPRIPIPLPLPSSANYHLQYPMVSFARSLGPWAGRVFVPHHQQQQQQQQQNFAYNAAGGGGGGVGGARYPVFRSAVAPPPDGGYRFGGEEQGEVTAPMVLDSVPVVQSHAVAAGKRFRLFGVNMDLTDSTDGDPGDSSIGSQASAGCCSSSSPSHKGKEKEDISLDLDM